MKERPILFSGPMVRALLAGTKTQTRRVMKPQPPEWCVDFGYTALTPPGSISGRGVFGDDGPAEKFFRCPYGQPGDRLWVREACRAHEITDAEYDGVHLPNPGTDGVVYLADGAFREIENTPKASDDWCRLFSYRGKRGATVPPIHMPRWASRITLEITNVRVERLQEISESDARAEGCPGPNAYQQYAALWDGINGEGSWAANPWVWVVEFRRIPQSQSESPK